MLEIDAIETPENVVLNRRLAGLGTRFIAGFVDNLYLFLLLLLLFIAWIVLVSVGYLAGDFFESEDGSITTWGIAFLIIVLFLIYWGYFAFYEYVTNGQTPGKKTMRIRVVKREGGAISFADVAIRNLLRVVDSLPFGYGVAGVCMFITKRSQRLGDLAAGTVVVDESVADYCATEKNATRRKKAHKKAGTPAEMDFLPPAEPDTDILRHAQVSAQEYRLLGNYWTRRHELTPEARTRILTNLMTPILQRHGRMDVLNSAMQLEQYVRAILVPGSSTPQQNHSVQEPPPIPPVNSSEPREGEGS